ncbi:MAG: PQQ-binding-like beta-propeller repeat protein [Proteobacteria bacterium]|nr:PQQ-binding-like beta-propeller repeat protein [Pseudomonadota bacterium]
MSRNFLILFLIGFMIAGCSHLGQTKKEKLELVNIWNTNIFQKQQFGSKRHESAAPLVINSDLFQGGSDGNLYVINKYNGSIKRVIKDSGGIEATPLFSQSVLYFGTNEGYVKAFSYRTGDYLWSYYVGFTVESSPFIYDGRLFVLASNDILYAFDAATGKILWTVKKDFPARRPVIKGGSSPVVYDNVVYVGFSDGSFIGANMFDGTIVLEKNLNTKGKFKDVNATPYVDEKYIVVPSYDGNLFCMERKTGNIIWSIQDGSAKSVSVISDVVYYSSDEGYVYNIDLTSGKVKWSTRLKDGGIPTAPAIFGDYIVVGSSERGIVLFKKDNGRFVKEFYTGTGSFADPVVEGNYIYFFSNYGVLYAFYKI